MSKTKMKTKAQAKPADKAKKTEEKVELSVTDMPLENINDAANKAPGSDTSGSLKNFRHHPDMENFYRFIFENELRFEALTIIDEILLEKQNRRNLRGAKSASH